MKKILIVDDDEDILIIVKEILISHGFEVLSHPIGIDVAEVVKFYQPNLILLDILLFGKSGTEICKDLKHIYSIPILLFSANVKKGNVFAECGADGFIQKPFEIDHLVNTINLHLN